MEYTPEFLLNKIPVGQWVKCLVEFMTDHFATQFSLFSDGLEWVISSSVSFLVTIPPLVMIGMIGAAAFFLHRRWKMALGLGLGLLLILNLGYWEQTIETVCLVLFSTLVSMAVGVPVGILAAHRPWVFTLLRPVLDLMQTIPTFVYLIPTLMLFGLGMVPGLISTVIFAVPAPIRLTYLGITNVPAQLKDAGKAFGASRAQLLFQVEMPHAMPTIMTGLTQCIMLSLSMVVIAALVGADGLGKPVVRALNTVNISQGFEAGLAIVIVAIFMDRMLRQPDPSKTSLKG